MSALADFYDLLLPELPGITTPMVDLHLREVARDFCVKTSAWVEDLTAISLVAEQGTYAVATPASSELVRITELTVAGELLWRLTDRNAERDTTSAIPKYQANQPPFQLSADLTQVTLIEVPTAAVVAGLKIKAALKPSPAAATLPDFLKAQHSEAMRHGVLSRLMAMGRKPWTDRELAVAYDARWKSAVNFAAYQATVGNTREPLRTKKWG
jgi:hypothetical protein